jgi:hypothetical protein
VALPNADLLIAFTGIIVVVRLVVIIIITIKNAKNPKTKQGEV